MALAMKSAGCRSRYKFMHGRLLILLPLIAAGFRVAALPGWFCGWMAILAVIPRLVYWESGGNKRGDFIGGAVFWGLVFTILITTAPFFPLGAGLLMGGVWVVEGIIYRRLRYLVSPLWAAPAALFAIQWLVGNWFFGGVPWASWGLGLADSELVLSIASVVGENGVSFLVVALGAWVYESFNGWREYRRLSWRFLPLVVLVAALLVAGRQQVTPAPHGEVSFMAVQPNIGLGEKSAAGGEIGIFEEHCRLVAEKLATSEQLAPQLLLWAETMFLLPATLSGSSGEIRRPRRGFPEQHAVNTAEEVLELQTTAARYAAEVVVDGGFFLTGAHLYRAISADAPPEQTSPRGSETLVFSKDGELLHHVGKSELVPFGESLPFGGNFPGSRSLARFIFDNFGLSPNFLRAKVPTPLSLVFADGRELKLGTAICWENAYEHVFREQAVAGAEAFCVISNEAWYGIGAEMKQMIAATRFRAVETARPVVRVTNTGHTVLVSAAGQIVAQISPGEAQVMVSALPQVAGDYQTAYLKWGWLLGPELAIGAILMALFVASRKSRDISS